MITIIVHNALFRGAVAGIGAAAVVDLHAFLSWKKVQDALTYDWSTAILRWTQGAVSGALLGAGFGAFTS